MPEGQTATLDFQGHSVDVVGIVEAGIDVSESAGTVVLFDSTYQPGDNEDAPAEPSAGVTVEANKAAAVVCGIKADYVYVDDSKNEESAPTPCLEIHDLNIEADLNTVDAASTSETFDCYGIYLGYAKEDDTRNSVDVLVDNCTLLAALNNIQIDDATAAEYRETYGEQVLSQDATGMACGIFTTKSGLRLAGNVVIDTASAKPACDIYSEVAPGFHIETDFTAAEPLSVCADGNALDVVFATIADEFEDISVLAMLFTDATDAQCAVEAKGNGLVFGETNTQNQQQITSDTEQNANPQARSTSTETQQQTSTDGDASVVSGSFEGYEDLNAAWEDTSSIFTVPEGNHSYYLSEDLYVKGSLFVQTLGQSVILDLNGHNLVFQPANSGSPNNSAIRVGSSGANALSETPINFSIVNTSEENSGVTFIDGGTIDLYPTTGAFLIQNVTVSEYYENYLTGNFATEGDSYTSTPGVIRVLNQIDNPGTDGTPETVEALRNMKVTIDHSTVIVDKSKKTSNSTSGTIVSAIGIWDEGALKSVDIINDSTISCVVGGVFGSSNKPLEAYAIYSRTQNGTEATSSNAVIHVSNSALKAQSPLGFAKGIGYYYSPTANTNVPDCPTCVVLDGSEVTFALKADQGVYGIDAGSGFDGLVTLNTKVNFTADTTSDDTALLVSEGVHDGVFVIGSSFEGSALPVLIGASAASANRAGTYLAKYDGWTPNAEQKATLASAFVSAKAAIAAVKVQADDTGVVFAVDESNAAASITDEDGKTTYYASVAEASAAAKNGQTIVLLKDTESVSFDPTDEEREESADQAQLNYSVDLNGKKVGCFTNSSKANVTVMTSSKNQPALTGASGDYFSALVNKSTGTLILEGVDIVISSPTDVVRAITVAANGLVELDEAKLVAQSSEKALYGAYVYGAGTLVLNKSDITVSSTYSTGKTVYGVNVATNAASTLKMTDSTVYAESATTAYGVYMLQGNASISNSSVSAKHLAGASSKNVYGIYTGGKTDCEITLDAASISATTASASEIKNCYAYWDNSKGTTANSPTLTLRGASSFISDGAAEIGGISAPFQLSETFSLKTGSTNPVRVAVSAELDGNILAKPVASEVLTNQNEMFAPASGDTYEGYDPILNDDGNVAYSSEEVARIGDKSYASVQSALNAAEAGETVTLLTDISTSRALMANEAVKLDLSGHTLTVNASSTSAASAEKSSALVLSKDGGSYVITDTADTKGKLVLDVGFAGSAYGMYLSGGGSLEIDGAAVEVNYTGSVAALYNATAATVYGISGTARADATRNQVHLTGQASLTINATKGLLAMGSTGASTAYGIYLPTETSTSTASGETVSAISIDRDATLSVNNASTTVSTGSISSNEQDKGNCTLRELNLDENSDLYKQIATEFAAVAKYDGTSIYEGVSTNTSVYGSGMYYAAPLTIDGTNYWVFSEPVAEAGYAKDKVPAKIYVRSTVQVAPDAIGISTKDLATNYASATIQGSVSAESTYGNAYAVQAAGSGSWLVDGASLSATSHAVSTYRGSSGETIKLSEVMGLEGNITVDFYPKNATNNEAKDMWPEAAAVSVVDEKTVVTLAGDTSIVSKADGAQECKAIDIEASKVYVDTTFALADGSDNPLSVLAPSGSNVANAVFASTSDDSELAARIATLFKDANGDYSSMPDGSDVKWGDTYTISFVDGFGAEVKKIEGVVDGQEVLLPAASSLERDRDSHYVYTFVGWSTDKNAAADSDDLVSGDDATLQFSSETASSGVTTYYAIYQKSPLVVNVTFEGRRDSSGSALASSAGDIAFGNTIRAASSEYAVDPSTAQTYTAEENGQTVTYYFVGWSTGSVLSGYQVTGGCFDQDFLFDLALEPVSNYQSYSLTFTAKYVRVAQDQYLAKFKLGHAIFAYAVNAGTSPEWKLAGAPNAALYPTAPLKGETGSTYAFAGWHKGLSNALTCSDSSETDYPVGTALPAGEAGAVATYTAWFTEAKSKVQFDFVYYMQNDDSTWTLQLTNQSQKLACDYGTDPSALVESDVKDFVQDGMAYTFLGWSTNYNDKEPMWEKGKGLPAATTSVRYWAVYDVKEQTADVEFVVGDATYAAEGVTVSTSIDDAFKLTGADMPGDAENGDKFLGWSDRKDDDSPLSGTTAHISDCTGVDTGKVTLYPVYGASMAWDVVLHANNGTNDSYTAQASDGGVVSMPADWYNYALAGHSFNGWAESAEASSATFDIARDAVSADMDLYAVYTPIKVDTTAAEGGSASAQAAWVRSDGAVGSEVVLSLAAVDAVDSNLSGAIKSSEKALQAYTVSLGWTTASRETTHVNDSFGTISVTLPVSADVAGHDIKAYFLKADGTIGSISTSNLSMTENEDGSRSATVDLTSYADSAFGGNLLLVSVLTAEEQQLANTKDNAKQTLNTELSVYFHQYEDEGNYDEAAYAQIEAAYNEGIAKIDAAQTAQEAADAANAALDAMASVTSKSALDTAKASALSQLASAYSNYSKSSYTDANWNSLVAAYDAAKANIEAATTVADAGQAASNGVAAMSAVTAGGTSSTSTNTTTSSGSGLTSSSGTSLTSSGGSALTSSSGSGLTSSSGSGLTSSSSSPEQQLGVTLEPVTSELMESKQLSADVGLYVDAVTAGGPAEAAGIQAGDVITKVDGTTVTSLEDLQRALEGKSAGDTVTLEVERDGEVMEYDVVLGESDADALGLTGASLTSSDGSDLLSNRGADDGAAIDSDSGDWLQWLQDNLAIVCLIGLLLLAAVAALIWWLLRRRNMGQWDESDDQEEGSDTPSSGEPAFQF